jgi:threonyl-tRNA synthetase
MSKEMIKITLPDGTILEKFSGITGMEIAEDISSGLAKQSILVELNGQLRDLSFPIHKNSELKILKKD